MSASNKKNKSTLQLSQSEPPLPKSSYLVWIICIGLGVLLAWSAIFELEEVSTGTGKVVPSSKDQVIQSLEGGILTKLNVKEGDIVKEGQVLAELDPTRFASNVDESKSLLLSAQATAARLRAEVNGTKLVFPDSLRNAPDLVREETQLYHSRQENLSASIAGLKRALSLVEQELSMTEPLVAKGAASEVEVLRLKRQANELRNQMSDIQNQYYVKAREELSKASTDIEQQEQVVKGRSDALNRAVFKAPVRGVVKEIDVMTIGGVVPQNGKLMTIVPLEDQLLIEARISPRDIAFIRPNQEALVKITAYDYSIYGGLKGKVKVISPDTIRDEVKQDQFYYRVYIRTETDKLYNKAGKALSLIHI